MAKRPQILSWVPGDDPSKISEPIDAKKNNGFIYKERPPFQYLNWLFNLIAKWIGFIDTEIDQFGVVAETIPSMSVVVRAGRKWDGATYTVKSDQTLGPVSAPAADPRIDRVVLNRSTLVASIVTGTEAASPSAPAIPANSLPLAQISLTPGTTEIEQSAITPETSAYHEFFGTETIKGVVRFATEAEVSAGTNTDSAVTPAGMSSTRRVDIKDHGSKSSNFTLNLNEADFHVIEFSANATLTIASTLTNDKAIVSVKTNGNTVTVAGIDNNPVTLTASASVQDIIGLIKSFGKITAVGIDLGESTA